MEGQGQKRGMRAKQENGAGESFLRVSFQTREVSEISGLYAGEGPKESTVETGQPGERG